MRNAEPPPQPELLPDLELGTITLLEDMVRSIYFAGAVASA